MIKELDQDINLQKINHAYFFECNNEDFALKRATDFAEAVLGGKLANNPDCKIVETDEKSIKVDQIRELQKDILLRTIPTVITILTLPRKNPVFPKQPQLRVSFVATTTTPLRLSIRSFALTEPRLSEPALQTSLHKTTL